MKTKNNIILLGASNLTLSLFQIIRIIQDRCGRPSKLLIAAGHGRSYGKFRRVFARGLPGIVDCALWNELSSTARRPTYAFMTDIGNDIPLGYTPEQIIGWVQHCIDRLQKFDVQIVISDMPLRVLNRLSEGHYLLARSLFFPMSRLTRKEAFSRVNLLSDAVNALAVNRSIAVCSPDPAWYGIDPIHMRWRFKTAAYQEILGLFDSVPYEGGQEPTIGSPMWGWWNRPRPRVRHDFFVQFDRTQPSGRMTDGTTISMY